MNLADHIKQELAAGREVRVHCDTWLAHRETGWDVCAVWGEHPNVEVVGHSFYRYPVPSADCTLVQPPLQVGDRVRNGYSNGTILGIHGTEVWFLCDRDGYSLVTRLSHLERLP